MADGLGWVGLGWDGVDGRCASGFTLKSNNLNLKGGEQTQGTSQEHIELHMLPARVVIQRILAW